ncbi:MAG: PAS domain-containing protein, partial [Acidobacteria bacterium]|nr:PAS domain-containing protein [Acidobacteriota bacterium]
MNESNRAEPASLRISDEGLIITANETAAKLLGSGELPGTPLSDVLDRSLRHGRWLGPNGIALSAETSGIRADSQPLEILLRLPDPAEHTITRRTLDSLLRITTDVARAGHAELDRVIVDALGRIGRLTGVDRAYLFMMIDENYTQNTHEWTRAGIDPQIDRLQQIPRQPFAWFDQRLRKDGYLVVHSLDEIPPTASDSRAILEEQGIRSLLAVGMFEGDELLGFAGFDAVSRETRWSGRSVERLQMTCELFLQSLLRARSQRALERTNELFNLLRIATNDLIYEWDLQRGIVSRDGLEEILGYTPSEETASPDWWPGLIHEEDRARSEQALERALEDPDVSVFSSDYRVRRADGDWAYLRDRCCVVRNTEGTPLRIIGAASDLTDRARTEEQLRKQEELFQYVRLATNDIIWDIDLQTGEAWRSEALESVLGVSPETMDFEGWVGRIHPDDQERCRSEMARLFDDSEGSFLEATYRIRHSDGHWVTVLDRGYVVRDEGGQAVRMIGTATDLTERMRAVARLEESEARFKAVVENVSDVITVVDRHGIIAYQSPASSGIFGLSPSELVGHSMFDRVHQEDRDRVERLFAAATSHVPRDARATFRYLHAAGHWLTMEALGANFLHRETLAGIVLVSRDITQRRRLEQQLERSTRLASLGHLASSVAHEFNNVLMGALPFIEVIKRTADDDKTRAAATRVGEALDRGKEISRSLLQFARPVAVSLEIIDLQTWLRAVADEVRSIVPRELEVEIGVPDKPLTVTADSAGLHQALLNLVLNACGVLENRGEGTIRIAARKASKEDRTDELLTGNPDDYVVLQVTDDGPQIGSDAIQHIFEPMFK